MRRVGFGLLFIFSLEVFATSNHVIPYLGSDLGVPAKLSIAVPSDAPVEVLNTDAITVRVKADFGLSMGQDLTFNSLLTENSDYSVFFEVINYPTRFSEATYNKEVFLYFPVLKEHVNSNGDFHLAIYLNAAVYDISGNIVDNTASIAPSTRLPFSESVEIPDEPVKALTTRGKRIPSFAPVHGFQLGRPQAALIGQTPTHWEVLVGLVVPQLPKDVGSLAVSLSGMVSSKPRMGLNSYLLEVSASTGPDSFAVGETVWAYIPVPKNQSRLHLVIQDTVPAGDFSRILSETNALLEVKKDKRGKRRAFLNEIK